MKKAVKLLLMLLAIPLTSCAGVANPVEQQISQQTEAKMFIRRLSSGIDANGHKYQSFTYTTTPTYCTEQIEVTLEFDDEEYWGYEEDYLIYDVDLDNKTVTVTCLQPFDSVATLTIRGFTSNVEASVTIDYLARSNGITLNRGAINSVDDILIPIPYDSSKYVNGNDTHTSFKDILSRYINIGLGKHTSGSCSVYDTSFGEAANATTFTHSPCHIGLVNNVQSITVGTWVTNNAYLSDKQMDPTTNFFTSALTAIDLNDANDGIYKRLDAAWSSASSATRNNVARALNDDGYFHLSVNLGTTLSAIIQNADNSYSTHSVSIPAPSNGAQTPGYFPINIKVQPIPSWGIGTRFTAISPETVSISF